MANSERSYYSFSRESFIPSIIRAQNEKMCEQRNIKIWIEMPQRRIEAMKDIRMLLCVASFPSYKLFKKDERKTNLKRSFQWINTRNVKSFPLSQFGFVYSSSFSPTQLYCQTRKTFLIKNLSKSLLNCCRQ